MVTSEKQRKQENSQSTHEDYHSCPPISQSNAFSTKQKSAECGTLQSIADKTVVQTAKRKYSYFQSSPVHHKSPPPHTPPPLPSSNVVSRLSFFFGVLRYLREKGEIASLKGVGGGGGWGEFLLFNAIWRSETVLRRKQTVSTSFFLFACRFKCDKTLVHTATISIVESEKC